VKRLLKFTPLIILITVLISYGQLLLMFPWQDDHTIFFKLAHINDKAGFFGSGPIGQGGYKYIITPFIAIYKLFGFNIFFYYLFGIIFYFLASWVIYKVISKILDKPSGMVAGLLFAAGFIASDGFIRIFNTLATSTSIILVSLLALSYWSYYKTKKLYWYLLSLFFYVLSIELFIIRTHYLLSVIVAFELIFLAFKEFPKSIFKSILRLTPFVYIFYRYFILNGDARSTGVKDFVIGLMHGQFYLLYGFLTSVAHLSVPDWFSNIFNKNIDIAYFLLFLIVLMFVVKSVRDQRQRFISIFVFLVIFIWYFVSKKIFNAPVLNLGRNDFFIVFLGGFVIFVFTILFRYLSKYGDKQKLFLFFLIWALANIAAYSAYSPTVSYMSVQRYLAHSFFAISAMFAVLFSIFHSRKNLISRIITTFVIVWGAGNLIGAFIYQKDIVVNRSNVEKKFYTELRSYLPVIKKGDILYFDVANDARQNFADCFSVASMPEETAIAWQYGIDRYDLRRITDFNDLTTLIGKGTFGDINDNSLKIGNVYSFYYSKNGLINTTTDLKKFINGTSLKRIQFESSDSIFTFPTPIPGYTPTRLVLKINATSKTNLQFPYAKNAQSNKNDIQISPDLKSLAFRYKNFKNDFYKQAKISASSDWREDIIGNAFDNNRDTVWRPDRINWHTGQEYLQFDLGKVERISKFVWVNAYGNNSPTKYTIEVSQDNKSWKEVVSENNTRRIESGSLVTTEFGPENAKYVRFRLISSLNDDSPGISEAWVVPVEFSRLNINEAETFLSDPFAYINDINDYHNTLREIGNKGISRVSWKDDKNNGWQTDTNSTISIVYDGMARTYEITLPTGGTKVTAIKLSDFQIPGTVTVDTIEWGKPALAQ